MKADVHIEDRAKQTTDDQWILHGDPLQPITTIGPVSGVRTKEQVDFANTTMMSGGGRWFTCKDIASLINGTTYWFHDGHVGWHLSQKCPGPVTQLSWSFFLPDLLAQSPGYKEVQSPFKGQLSTN